MKISFRLLCPLLILASLFTSCSRELIFVKVNPAIKTEITHTELKNDSDLAVNNIEESDLLQVIKEGRDVDSTLNIDMAVNEPQFNRSLISKTPDQDSERSLTKTLSLENTKQKQQLYSNKTYRRNYTFKKHYDYKVLMPVPPQNGKTYLGAALMIVGAAAVLLGIFSITGGAGAVWAIILGSLAFIAGAAFLVSGSMSSRYRNK
ncbi:hypothetical protein [Solitalea lacus]|uniref:hypothetical protein n=1 Tax=Solitalea lacus TaxID=2911172 RepID=UPI001EDC7111|nr:hypothetical protein [Solitalea lacus]UKJ07976.1 hypothetical protein L2B55_02130 [Solitalea lacus]